MEKGAVMIKPFLQHRLMFASPPFPPMLVRVKKFILIQRCEETSLLFDFDPRKIVEHGPSFSLKKSKVCMKAET